MNTASFTLPAFISHNMVLQEGVPVPLWGWAKPGTEVTVRFAGQTKTATANHATKWQLYLDPLPASAEGRELIIELRGQGTAQIIENVLVGEVWLCSGQSNMDWPVELTLNGALEVAAADHPLIRLFTIPKVAISEPQTNVQGSWSICQPQTIGTFSAVGYFFGRKLQQDLGVPIGLINCSWGGSMVEPWTSREALQSQPEARQRYEAFVKGVVNYDEALADYQARRADWVTKYLPQDPGNTGYTKGWAAINFDAADWEAMEQPGTWQSRGLNFNGVLWFRKEVEIPAAWAGKDLKLSLGYCDDYDTTYFNNTFVGAIGSENVFSWCTLRMYTVPAALVKAGHNLITVRIFDHLGGGGFTSQAAQMYLTLATGSSDTRISLSGPWKYKVEYDFGRVQAPAEPSPPVGPNSMGAPTALYNGMLAPLVPFALRGAIWYQGESNANRGWQYRRFFPLMVQDWRQRWGRDFPFLFVQLANYMAVKPEPSESQWAELRESQLATLALPNTGMAVAIDLGEATDIHPKNKQDVGLRLALSALAQTYGRKELPYSGPICISHTIEGSKVRLHFRHATGGLVAKGGKLTGFAIAGTDRKFEWADATIGGETIVVSSAKVPQPMAVRYAWADNPVCNLYNGAGLPASPFRTDDWPLTTQVP